MSTEALREIRLYGHLGREFGRVHRLAVQSSAEAIRALCALFAGFEKAVLSHDRYHVLVGREYRDESDLHFPAGNNEVIKIVPVVAGAKDNFIGGLVRVIAGAALAVIGVAMGGVGMLTGNGFLIQAGITIGNIGLAIALGGIAQMLTPTPKKTDTPTDNQSSYVFSGASNTSAQGATIPVGYGRLIVGSVIASAGIYAEDYVASTPTYSPGGGGTGPYPSDPGYSYPKTPEDGQSATGSDIYYGDIYDGGGGA